MNSNNYNNNNQYNNGGNGNNNNNNGNNGGSGNGGNNNPQNRNKKSQTIIILIIAAIVTIFASSIMSSLLEDATTKEISYDEFIKKVEDGEVEKVVFSEGKIVITPKGDEDNYFNFTYWTTELMDEELIPLLKEKGIEFKGKMSDQQSSIITFLLEWILPFALIYLIMGLLFRKVSKGSGMMGVGKSNAKVYVEKQTGVTFADVAGQDEAKESLTEIVDFLQNPGKYVTIGAKLPKGALLVGPPGTGKTLLAKAVAGEGHVPFFSLSGSDFVEMFVGVGASRVRDLFKQAQQSAPCIIFIDEIDAIGKSRDSRYGGGNDEREQTLNQLLAEMDGFDSSKGVFILAATNRPEVLDKALLRPGRFDRRIIVEKPDLKGREETLKVHSRNVSMDETVDLHEIALMTSGAVGSDLANMINEAAINAVKHGRKAISQVDLQESVEVVIAGKEKKDRILSPFEKKTVAYHEVGHAMVTALEKKAEPVQKITIVPRTMGALGYVLHIPEEEKFLMTKDAMLARIITLLGGRAAEEIVFEMVTTGASDDMEKATNLARAMITQYGMSEKFGLMSLETVENKYLDGRTRMNCSDATAAEVDEEVKKLLKDCYARAKQLLSENREALNQIAEFLYEKETITGKEFMEIFKQVTEGEEADDGAEKVMEETTKKEEKEEQVFIDN
ncbi:MAG: ATP-dependent zinc metalloprotease FtsH [Lachnospiraceae bacterium]|nr:ATP-dependent zinc metalloprotease FtsH [Lachnospiraceae bacterium]